MDEQVLWEGSPSLIIGFEAFVGYGFLILILFILGVSVNFIFIILMLISLVGPLIKYLQIKSVKYKLTTERLMISRGILDIRKDQVELYRIKDTTLDTPFLYRLFKVGNILLKSSDKSHPNITLLAVSEPEKISENIRHYVETQRDKKRVREVDVE